MPSKAPTLDTLDLEVIGELTDEHLAILAQLLVDLSEAETLTQEGDDDAKR